MNNVQHGSSTVGQSSCSKVLHAANDRICIENFDKYLTKDSRRIMDSRRIIPDFTENVVSWNHELYTGSTIHCTPLIEYGFSGNVNLWAEVVKLVCDDDVCVSEWMIEQYKLSRNQDQQDLRDPCRCHIVFTHCEVQLLCLIVCSDSVQWSVAALCCVQAANVVRGGHSMPALCSLSSLCRPFTLLPCVWSFSSQAGSLAVCLTPVQLLNCISDQYSICCQ